MNRALFAAAVIVLTGAAAAGIYLATAKPERASDAPATLRVGLYENEPKIYTGPDGNPAGLFPGLIESIAAEKGWSIEWLPCQWAQCLSRLETGELDLMPDVAVTEDRLERFDFHEVPVAQAWSQLYTAPGSRIFRLASLAQKRIAVLQDSAQQHFLDNLRQDRLPHFEIVEYDSMAAALASVADGDSDAAATNNFFGRRQADRFGLIESPITFDQTNLYYAAPAGAHSTLLESIDEYLRAWKADTDSPYYQAMLEAITPPVSDRMPAWLTTTLLAAGALIAALLANTYFLRWRIRSQTRKLHESGHRLEHMLASSPVILFSLRGRDMRPEWVSGNIERILSFSSTAVLEPDWWERQIHPEDYRSAVRQNARLFDDLHVAQEYRIFDGHGKTRHIRDERRLIQPAVSGEPETVIGSWTDLTAEYERREQVNFLSHYDPRTGLPNRSLLVDRIEQAIKRASAAHNTVLIVLIDLDRFKHINDTLGMTIGDQVLEETAARLKKVCSDEDTVARAGSDEFCLVIEDHTDRTGQRNLLEAISNTLAEPMEKSEHRLVMAVSIGVAVFPEDGHQREELLSAAELALEAAKQAGGNQYRYYEPGLGERTSRKLYLEHELRQAISGDELQLYFQPQFRLGDNSICAAEALVRWNHPERGMISPGEFIPLAEETGIIEQLDRWVLEQACRQMALWDQRGQSLPQVSINLSAREFYDETLVTTIEKILAAYDLAPTRLGLEITETMLMEFPEKALKVLRKLDDMGVKLCMDDFGSGYSNLAYLRRLPLHQIKIDQSLVQDIEHSHHNQSIIHAIIAMAGALNLELVAEGIENHRQLEFLRAAGCSIGQGYLLGLPLPAEQALAGRKPIAGGL